MFDANEQSQVMTLRHAAADVINGKVTGVPLVRCFSPGILTRLEWFDAWPASGQWEARRYRSNQAAVKPLPGRKHRMLRGPQKLDGLYIGEEPLTP
jgi:hypothetical protein